MVKFQLMRYFNLSAFQRVNAYWHEFPLLQRLTIVWVVTTLLVSVVFFVSQKVMPENPTVFRYFVSLYGINSLLFFLLVRDNVILSRTLLVFLLLLEVLVCTYYGLNYLSLGSL